MDLITKNLEFLSSLRGSKATEARNSKFLRGFRAHKGLGRSPYKICELDLSSLKASKNLEFLRKNLEFLRMNLEFLEIASLRSQ